MPTKEQRLARRLRFKEKHPKKAAEYARRRKFGLEAADYTDLLDKQGGLCALCLDQEPGFRRGVRKDLAVDHCHATGKVRGLLCSRCNTGLGLLGDDPDRLLRAAHYIFNSRTANT